jgi:hypothetical protein
MVIALEIPARDHPVSTDIGCKYTASENIAPIPTHVISAPAPTITQRYDKPTLKSSLFQGSNCAAKPAAFPNKTNGNPRKIHSRKLFLEGPRLRRSLDVGIAHDRTISRFPAPGICELSFQKAAGRERGYWRTS